MLIRRRKRREIDEAEEMEIPAWLFFSFWGVTSFTSLHLGFRALDQTQLSHSVPPIVMFLFKHSLAVSSCFSSNYALKFRAQSTYSTRSNYVLWVHVFSSVIFPRTIDGTLIWYTLRSIFAFLFFPTIADGIPESLLIRIMLLYIFFFLISVFLVMLSQFVESRSLKWLVMTILVFCYVIWYLKFFAHTVDWFVSATRFLWFPILIILFCITLFHFIDSELKNGHNILFALEISLFFASGKKKRDFSPILVVSISHFISVAWAAVSRFGDHTNIVSGDTSGWFVGLVNVGAGFVGVKMEGCLSMLKDHKVMKFVEFAVGTVGAIFFQNYFRITSFSEVAVFLYFAVTWVANLVMLGFWGDFGLFNFLLGNVVVGCTVGRFGLHGETWVALGAALLLFALRLKLESLHLVYGEGQRIQL